MIQKLKIEGDRSDRVRRAVQIAERVHEGQRDKLGIESIGHVLAVADAVRHLGEDYEITALLHDSVEDCTDSTIVSLPLIEDLFGAGVRDAVDRMTKRNGEIYGEDYLRRVARSPVSKAVKLADIAHNCGRLNLLPDLTIRRRLEQKYRAASKFLANKNFY